MKNYVKNIKMINILNNIINILNRPINQFDAINVGYAGDGNIRCYYCNKPLCMVYLGDNNVVIINSEIAYNCSKTGEKISDYIHTSCSLSDITNKGYLETNIHVKNGQLVFANFFENEKLYDFDEDKRYKDETNICYVTGRNNLMATFSTQECWLWSNRKYVYRSFCK